MGKKLSANERIELYRALRLMQRGKVQIYAALQKVQQMYSKNGKPSTPLAAAAQSALVGLASGKSFASSLVGSIPDTDAAVLAAGERSGDLVGAYADATKLIQRQKKMVAAIRGGTAYPIFIFVLIAFCLVGASYELVPKFERISHPDTWQGAAAALYTLSYAVRNFGLWFLLVLFILIVAIWRSMGRWSGGARIFFDRLPPWSIYRTVQGATFLSNLAVMLKAGSQLQDALVFLRDHAKPWLRVRIQDTIYGIGQGRNLGQALEDAGYDFPSKDAMPFISIIAEQEGFESGLADFAEDWLDHVVTQLEAAGKIIFVIGLGFAGFFLGLIWLGISSLSMALS